MTGSTVGAFRQGLQWGKSKEGEFCRHLLKFCLGIGVYIVWPVATSLEADILFLY